MHSVVFRNISGIEIVKGVKNKNTNSGTSALRIEQNIKIVDKDTYDYLEKRDKIKYYEDIKVSRTGDQDILDQIFPPPLPDPAPVLTKYLKRDYVLFDTTDDEGLIYRYGIFAVYSSFVLLDSNGDYLDPTKASNVSNETRVLIVKTLIQPECVNPKKISPIFISPYPKIDFQVTSLTPTEIVDEIYSYQTGGTRSMSVKKNTKKIVLRDDMQDVIDPLNSPFYIDTAISENQMYFDPNILNLYYTIVNETYIPSSTPYNILMQTIIVMLGI